jgi:hypothetical protein
MTVAAAITLPVVRRAWTRGHAVGCTIEISCYACMSREAVASTGGTIRRSTANTAAYSAAPETVVVGME